MGNSNSATPTNRTDHKVLAQKLENAKKLGILSLSRFQLTAIPDALWDDAAIVQKLSTLDLSHNQINMAQLLLRETRLPERLHKTLKNLNLDSNNNKASSSQSKGKTGGKNFKKHSNAASGKATNETSASLPQKRMDWSSMTKLTQLSLASNQLGAATSQTSHGGGETVSTCSVQLVVPLPLLPVSLKSLNLSDNGYTIVPFPLCNAPSSSSSSMSSTTVIYSNLEALNLSTNQLTTLPDDMFDVVPNLVELNLDSNRIVTLAQTNIGRLKRLKILSLRDNQLQMTTSESSSAVKPPLPAPLFTDTALTDLNLHGNTHLTRTLLNQRFVGYDAFLERRSKIKSKAAGISALSDCDGCGLE